MWVAYSVHRNTKSLSTRLMVSSWAWLVCSLDMSFDQVHYDPIWLWYLGRCSDGVPVSDFLEKYMIIGLCVVCYLSSIRLEVWSSSWELNAIPVDVPSSWVGFLWSLNMNGAEGHSGMRWLGMCLIALHELSTTSSKQRCWTKRRDTWYLG